MSDSAAPKDTAATENTPKISWDDSQMKSSYANVCNVTGTQEEVVLFFGISHPQSSGEPQVNVQLSDRIILSPFAAKRLTQLLNRVVEQWEQRFGGAASLSSVPAASDQKN